MSNSVETERTTLLVRCGVRDPRPIFSRSSLSGGRQRRLTLICRIALSPRSCMELDHVVAVERGEPERKLGKVPDALKSLRVGVEVVVLV